MRVMESTDNRKYSLLIILQGVIFAAIDVFSKIVYQTVPVYIFMSFRFGLTSVILLLLYRKTIINDLRTTPFRTYALSGICLGLSILLSGVAINNTAATNYAFLKSLSAIIAPLLMVLFFHRPYTLRDLFVHIPLVGGLYLFCARGGLTSFGLGEAVSLCCAVLAAVSLVFGADALHHVQPQTLTFVQMTVGLVLSVFAGLSTGVFSAPWQDAFFTARILGILLFNSIIGSVVAYLLQNIALMKVSPKTVGVLQCSYPILTTVLANFLVDEHLSTAGIFGALIISSCIVAQSLIQTE